MPKLTASNPKYRLHRASGQALVTLDGRDFYLGAHGTYASRREYDRLIGEWLAAGRRLPRQGGRGGGGSDLTVVELVAGFWKHALVYYRHPSGHSGELGSFRMALGHLKRLYGCTPACEFGPLALKVIREDMVKAGWSRRYVNRQVEKVRRVFRWGVEQELLPPSVYEGLRAVQGLRMGKTEAPEGEPVRPVPEERVAAVLPHLSRQVRSMVELQVLTGMRPGEVCVMRTCDIDRGGRLWTYRPASHKTAHRGHERTVYIGPKGQALLEPLLKPELQAYLFSPAEAAAGLKGA